MAKTVISQILNGKLKDRDWSSVDKASPPINEPILVRIKSSSEVFSEDETSIYPVEDMKIAYRTADGMWKICPPYPMRDYSLLSEYDRLKPGAVVTHWAHGTSDEVCKWATRLAVDTPFHELTLKVDSDFRNVVYRALVLSAYLISGLCDLKGISDDERKKYTACYSILSDLQSCMDAGGHIDENDPVFHGKVHPFKTVDDVKSYLTNGAYRPVIPKESE